MEVPEPVDSAGADAANILPGHHEPDDMITNHWHCDPDGYHLPTLYLVLPVVDKGPAPARSVGNLGCGIRKKTIFLGDVENATIAGVVDWNSANVDPLLAGNIIDGCAKLDATVAGAVLVAVGNDGMALYVNGILPVLFIPRGPAVRPR